MPWSEGCALCGRDDSPDKTLICDRCDREIHMFCLEPKLKKVGGSVVSFWCVWHGGREGGRGRKEGYRRPRRKALGCKVLVSICVGHNNLKTKRATTTVVSASLLSLSLSSSPGAAAVVYS